MNKEVILHIGMPKTATSSIQATIHDENNLSVFQKNNISFTSNTYCATTFRFYLAFTDAIELDRLSRQNLTYDLVNQSNELLQNELKILLNDNSRILISSEYISLFSINELSKLKNFMIENCDYEIDFKIISYIREPISYINSFFQQCIQNNGANTLDTSFMQRTKNHYSSIHNAVQVFGKDCIKIYKFEDACKFQYGPVGFLLSEIGLANEDLNDIHYRKVNEGISAEATYLIQYINTKEPYLIDNILNPARQLNDMGVFRDITGTKLHLPKELLLTNLEYIKDELTYLKTEFNLDYTNFEYDLSKYTVVENIYDKDSVISVYNSTASHLKPFVIEYYELKDSAFAKTLHEPDISNSNDCITIAEVTSIKSDEIISNPKPIKSFFNKLSTYIRNLI